MRNGRPHARLRFVACAIVLLAGGPAVASGQDPVHFADANLRTAVEQQLGVTDPTAADMLGLFDRADQLDHLIGR
ncbi:MAG: hypothetical protein KBE04_00715 [Phycisphaerae bacterium]|nr:hypothetical protein [Phycisphaerae bacterium]